MEIKMREPISVPYSSTMDIRTLKRMLNLITLSSQMAVNYGAGLTEILPGNRSWNNNWGRVKGPTVSILALFS